MTPLTQGLGGFGGAGAGDAGGSGPGAGGPRTGPTALPGSQG
jgi:hypothetical protein